jgi:hypothetical protein
MRCAPPRALRDMNRKTPWIRLQVMPIFGRRENNAARNYPVDDPARHIFGPSTYSRCPETLRNCQRTRAFKFKLLIRPDQALCQVRQ